ncbi:ABC transporter substrate-binding protein [Naasia aerilata]|uniref:Peptide ABC transporter substrate-binding protein n=1 Tax=Naasia aerilata TaxID=1162966 RepID=A0ABN6XPF9_9MICO|nr:ABC transporter substrate-binding protein [Naasia aerilata]BDZ46038.1 peptide ABC transporter substrate-binding protein [Naasia aerilata]
MTSRSRLLAATAALAVTGIALAGCSGGGGSSSKGGSDDDKLVVAVGTPPVSLDTLKAATGVPGTWFETPAYAGILTRDADGKIQAGLAEKWEYVGDANTDFEFTLRDKLTFADGTPLDAKAAAASLDYFTKTTTGPSRAYFAPMTFTAKDDLTVHITSAVPNPIIPDLLTVGLLGGAPISPAGIADESARAGDTYGAGQYVLDPKKTVSGDHYVYVPNKKYWDQKAVTYSEIDVRVIPNAQQQVQALKSGEVDAIVGDPSIGGTVSGNGLEEIHQPSTVYNFYLMDRGGKVVPALANEKVRQALNFAVDREAIAKAALGDYGKATDQTALDAGEAAGYDPKLEKEYTYDPAKAKALLKEAGFADGFTLPATYLGFSPTDSKIAQAVASQLAEVGVTMQLKSEPDFGTWVNDLVANTYGATLLTGGGSQMYIDAQFAFTQNAVMNQFGVANSDIDAAFQKLASAAPDEIGSAAQGVSSVIVKQALSLPIATSDSIIIYNSKKVKPYYLGSTGELAPIESWPQK